MSLLDYFKQTEGSLSNPRGSSSKVIPSSAIVAANSEIEKSVCSKSRKGLKKKVYLLPKRTSPNRQTCMQHRSNSGNKKLLEEIGSEN